MNPDNIFQSSSIDYSRYLVEAQLSKKIHKLTVVYKLHATSKDSNRAKKKCARKSEIIP